MTIRNPADRRLILFTLALAHVSVGILNTLPGASLLQLAQNTQTDLASAGAMFTASACGFLLGALLAGVLPKRVKPNMLLLSGLLLLAIGSLMTPLTGSFLCLLAGQTLKGFGIGFINIGLNTIITLSFPDTLSEKLNIIHGMYGLGALLGPLFLAISLPAWHNLALTYLPGTILSICAGILALWLRVPDNYANQPREQAVNVSELRRVLGQGLLWLLALQIGLYASAEVGFGNWIVTIVSKGAGISLSLAAPVATTFYLGLTIGRLGGANLLKRAWISETRLLYSSLAGGILVGVLIACFPDRLMISYVGSVLLGCCYGPLFPSIMAIVSRRFARVIGPVSSIMMVSNGLTTMIVPLAMGLLLPAFGINVVIAIPALLCLAIFPPLVQSMRLQRTTLQSSGGENTIVLTTKTTGVS